MENKIKQLQTIIDRSSNIVFFGGAGVSTESGIPDFRSESGIFKSLEKYGDTPENLVSHTYYMDHTEEFFEYYDGFAGELGAINWENHFDFATIFFGVDFDGFLDFFTIN